VHYRPGNNTKQPDFALFSILLLLSHKFRLVELLILFNDNDLK